MSENTSDKLKNKIIDRYNEMLPNIDGFSTKRTAAFDSFLKNGFPNQKMEDWRFTPLHFLSKYDFNLCNDTANEEINRLEFEQLSIPDVGDLRIVFINGRFSKLLSTINKSKVEIISLKEAIEKYPYIMEKKFGTLTDLNDGFQNLNNALFDDGIFLYIPKNESPKEIVHLIFINYAKHEELISLPRNLIYADSGSSVNILESIHTIGEKAVFTNSVTEIFALENAKIDYSKFQNIESNSYYIGTTKADLSRNAVLESTTTTLKGKFVRNNLELKLNGDGSETILNGFYFLDGYDFADNHTLVDHAVPNSTSNEIYKGIMNDNSKAVFNGKIIVRPDAQKTAAYQTNRNILLSDDAEINTKPQLEIYADDVKCSHGATSGKIDNEEMFYLKSRGISEEKAQSLLLNAFADEIIEKIKIPNLRNEIKMRVAKRLNIDDVYFCRDLV